MSENIITPTCLWRCPTHGVITGRHVNGSARCRLCDGKCECLGDVRDMVSKCDPLSNMQQKMYELRDLLTEVVRIERGYGLQISDPRGISVWNNVIQQSRTVLEQLVQEDEKCNTTTE